MSKRRKDEISFLSQTLFVLNNLKTFKIELLFIKLKLNHKS